MPSFQERNLGVKQVLRAVYAGSFFLELYLHSPILLLPPYNAAGKYEEQTLHPPIHHFCVHLH